MVRQNLARTDAGGFLFVNAWNEWGEGAAIEPSLQWGRRWLEATHEAVMEAKVGKVNLSSSFIQDNETKQNHHYMEVCT